MYRDLHSTSRWSLWLPGLGCWLGAWWAGPRVLGLEFAMVLVAALVLLRSRRASRHTATILALATLLSSQLPPTKSARVVMPAGMAIADVTVIDTQVRREGGSICQHALVRVERGRRLSDSAAVTHDVQLWVRHLSFAPGTRARVLLEIRPAPTPRNVSQPFGWPRRAQGHARLVGHPSRVKSHHLGKWMHNVRATSRAALYRDLDEKTAAFTAALTLGDQGLIEPRDAERVRKSGAAHVLAVSGLHIGVVSFITLWGLRRMVVGVGSLFGRTRAFDLRRLSHGLVIPITLAHGLLAGGSPSALRASWMVAGAHLALMFGFRPCARGALMILPLLAAAYDATLLLRPAFALSYLACLVLAHALEERGLAAATLAQRWLYRTQHAVVLSTRISVATTPVVLSCFGQLAWIGALSNVLFVPLSSLVLVPFAYFQLLASALGLGTYAAPVSSGLRDLLLLVCSLAERAPTIETHDLSVSELVAISLVCGAFFCVGRLRWVALLAFAVAATWSPLEARISPHLAPKIELRFIDVGQGDATLLRHRAKFAMVDMGRTVRFGDRPQDGARSDAVIHSLRAQRIHHLELLVISHAHPDHYASWSAVSEQVRIEELWLPTLGHPAESAHFRALVDGARARGTRVRLATELCGKLHQRIGLHFEVLAPCTEPSALDSLNDASIVVRVAHGKRRILFAGDIESKAEEHLLAAGVDLRADIIKVPHHGSRTSSSLPFVRAVGPGLAIISAGSANRFGHPHPDIVKRWQRGACVLLTARHGGITLYSDARGWRLREPEHVRHCVRQGHSITSLWSQ